MRSQHRSTRRSTGQDSLTNSIGMLLAHIAAVETSYKAHTFGDMEEVWNTPAHVLGEVRQQHIKGYDLEHYLAELATVRERTLQGFTERDDDWLYEQTPFWNNKLANNYFKWFHVLEDETSHRGQILFIRNFCADH